MWKFLFVNFHNDKNVTFLLKETLAKLWSHFFHAIHASHQSKASVYIYSVYGQKVEYHIPISRA